MLKNIKKINIESPWKKISIILGINLIFYILNASSYLISMSQFCTEGFEFSPLSHLLDLIIYMLISFIILFITNNLSATNWILTIFYFIFTVGSCIKTTLLLSPLYLSDLSFINEGTGDILSLLNKEVIFYFIKLILSKYILNFLVLFLMTFLFCIAIITINKKQRLIGVLVSTIILVIVLIPSVFKIFINYESAKYETSNQYAKHGLFAGLYSYDLYSKISTPEGYEETKVKEILDNYKSKNEVETWGSPNVIVVLSESFFDVTKIEEIKYNKDIFENYNYIKENSTSFNIISSTYAGKTGNIEFEYNTLSSLKYFTEAIIPYNTFYTNENMEDYPSIAKIFNKNDYVTNIYSPFDDGNVYKVKNVYPKLGYQNIFFFSDLKNRTSENIVKGVRFVSDEILMDFVIEDIETSEKPVFSFVKSVQNHMPYYLDRYYENGVDISEIKASSNSENCPYDETELKHFSSYGQGIYDNGKALLNLYNYINSIEEPTVVIFFGDHLPNITDLTDTGRDLLQDSKFLNSENNLENLYNKYCTEGLIFSNYDIDTSDIKNYMSFDLLSNYILKHLDIDKGILENYIDYIYDTMYMLPSSNRFISVFEDSSFLKTADIDSSLKEYYDLRGFLQYYYLKNNYSK